MGQPKAMLRLGGRTFLERVADAVAEDCGEIVLVAAADQLLPSFPFPCKVVRDQIAFEGPLGAIAWGMEACDPTIERIVVASCDVPLLSAAFARRLLEELGDCEIAVPFVNGQLHPLVAAYRRGVATTARALFAQGMRRPIALFDHHIVHRLGSEQLTTVDPDLRSLRNANTPAEFSELEALFHADPGTDRDWQHRSS